MNVSLRKPMTLTEFLALEERQELRFEFNGCEPVDMTGGTIVLSSMATGMPASVAWVIQARSASGRGASLFSRITMPA